MGALTRIMLSALLTILLAAPAHAQFGGILQIPEMELTGVLWQIGRDGAPAEAQVRLMTGGRIEGYNSFGLVKWTIEGASVVLYDQWGQPQARIAEFGRASDGKWQLKGLHMTGAVIVLKESSGFGLPQAQQSMPPAQPAWAQPAWAQQQPAPPPAYTPPPPVSSGSYVTIAGRWNTTEGVMTLSQNGSQVTGSYTNDGGEITGMIDGNVLNGYWIENGSNRRCDRPMNGRYHWGRFVARFESASFTAQWGYCDDNPTASWTGSRTDAAPAVPTAPAAASGYSLYLNKTSFAPGEQIQVSFTANPNWNGDAWVGIVPSHIEHGNERRNDDHDVSYQYLNKRASGTLTFTAPGAGAWDFRMHDTDNNGREIASVGFTVGSASASFSGRTVQVIAQHSNKCLDVAGAGKGNTDNVQQWNCHNGDNQKWTLVDKGNGYYSLVARHSGKCLDVAGVSKDTGANVFQWDCHGGDNQQWKLVDKGNGYYSIVARHSGKCLDVSGVSTNNGANVYQWDCHGGGNQLWLLR